MTLNDLRITARAGIDLGADRELWQACISRTNMIGGSKRKDRYASF